jgi:hypothetical protein
LKEERGQVMKKVLIAGLFVVALLYVFVGPYKYIHVSNDDVGRFEYSHRYYKDRNGIDNPDIVPLFYKINRLTGKVYIIYTYGPEQTL